ncbi:uncharacterized protein J4E92_006081 [Alternaria infectoria]|uniref:uncharacterized protein n=1 Tax=Alternaria infectoria TaxID=45303 RepID=UPI00221FBDE2|nr:uncharacterized protein J4E92_006081 [Alternaria infectoria]KAI4926920.1 hypothetical protein J4E92_006081 [Alternaria infectoria]
MSSPPAFGETCDERFDRNLPDDLSAASKAGPSAVRYNYGVIAKHVWYNGNLYPYTFVGSRTLVEDAQAVLNGEASYLLDNDGILGDVDQDYVNAIAPQMNMLVALQANGPDTAPLGGPPQLQPPVPVALINPTFNNQVQHAAVTIPQCPYGCAGTFGRPGEYNRHMKKHNGPFFPCTQPSCGMIFYRRDKLRDHLARGH